MRGFGSVGDTFRNRLKCSNCVTSVLSCSFNGHLLSSQKQVFTAGAVTQNSYYISCEKWVFLYIFKTDIL